MMERVPIKTQERNQGETHPHTPALVPRLPPETFTSPLGSHLKLQGGRGGAGGWGGRQRPRPGEQQQGDCVTCLFTVELAVSHQ